MTGEQGSLFETPPEQRPPERSMDEIAAHMAAHAPADPYAAQEAREADIVAQRDGEDLAAEQTGFREAAQTNDGEAAESTPTSVRPPRPTRPLLEMPRQGGSNWRYPTRAQVQRGLTDDHREATARGAQAAREILRRNQGR
jgi:hypothetical protein